MDTKIEIQKSAAIAQRKFWSATTEENIDSIISGLESVEEVEYFFKTIDFDFFKLSHLQQNCLTTLNSSSHKILLRRKTNLNAMRKENSNNLIETGQEESTPDYQKIAKDYIKIAEEKERRNAADTAFVIPLLLAASLVGYILPSPFGVYGFFGILILGFLIFCNNVSND